MSVGPDSVKVAIRPVDVASDDPIRSDITRIPQDTRQRGPARTHVMPANRARFKGRPIHATMLQGLPEARSPGMERAP